MTRRFSLTLRILTGVGFAVLIASIVAAFFVEEPMRRWFVREINDPLDGYSVGLGGVDLHSLSASVTLEDLVVIQDALPEPPLVEIPRIDAAVDWRALLSGAVVVSVRVERPIARIDLEQLRKEAGDPAPISEKGWQEAINNVTPVKVNALRVIDGVVSYLDQPGSKPIRIEKLNVRASNIRNVSSPPGEYPSPIQADAQLLGTAALHVEGAMDFLATPRAAGRVDFTLANVPLERIEPVAHHAGLALRGGILAAKGTLESTSEAMSVVLREVTLDKVEADYVETGAATAGKEATKAATKVAAKAATTSATESQVRVVIDSLEVNQSTFGFVNATVDPDYRLFIDVSTASLRDFSNGKRQKDAPMMLDGTFMDSGTLRVRGKIRPDQNGPDFEVSLELKDTEIRTLNEALRAHGGLDVVAGQLSVFSEVSVRDRRVAGYVKPLFVDLDVYDPAQDREKPILNKIYQSTVGAVANLLKNKPLERVATVTPIEGTLDAVDTGGWRTFVLLLRNAFVEAIRGGLEGESAT